MEPYRTIPNCVRKRQLDEMFVNKRKVLAKQMSHLNSASLDSLTIEQLNDVMRMIKFDKQELNEPISKYLTIIDKYPKEARKLIADYNKALSKTKHFINAKYEFGGDKNA